MRLFIQTNTKITIVFAVLAQLQTDIAANIRKAAFTVHTSFQPFPTFDFSLKFSAKALFLLFKFKNICNYYIYSNYSTLVPPPQDTYFEHVYNVCESCPAHYASGFTTISVCAFFMILLLLRFGNRQNQYWQPVYFRTKGNKKRPCKGSWDSRHKSSYCRLLCIYFSAKNRLLFSPPSSVYY